MSQRKIVNFPTIDSNGNCKYCCAPIERCWCGIKHTCLVCHQNYFGCSCERIHVIKDRLRAIIYDWTGPMDFMDNLVDDICKKMNLTG